MEGLVGSIVGQSDYSARLRMFSLIGGTTFGYSKTDGGFLLTEEDLLEFINYVTPRVEKIKYIGVTGKHKIFYIHP